LFLARSRAVSFSKLVPEKQHTAKNNNALHHRRHTNYVDLTHAWSAPDREMTVLLGFAFPVEEVAVNVTQNTLRSVLHRQLDHVTRPSLAFCRWMRTDCDVEQGLWQNNAEVFI